MSAAKRRGRPPGSVSLTAELQDRICQLRRTGSPLDEIADIVGKDLRTIQGWIDQGEGKSNKPSTPKTRVFAKAWRRAGAEPKVSARVRLAERNPDKALDRMLAEKTEAPAPPSVAEVLDLATALVEARLRAEPGYLLARCRDDACHCANHTPPDNEQQKEE